MDSGIIVGRGNDVRFWHLTFQEFLAAKAIASRLDAEQQRILLCEPRQGVLARWREVVLLLAGVLHQQGRAKVDGFVRTLLDVWDRRRAWPTRPAAPDCSGGMLRDLEPFKYQRPDARYHGLLAAGDGHLRPAAVAERADRRAHRRGRRPGTGGRPAD